MISKSTMAMARGNDNRSKSILVSATVTVLALMTFLFIVASNNVNKFILASNDDKNTIRYGHRQLNLALVDPKSVRRRVVESSRVVKSIIAPTDAGEEIGSNTCKPHIMFSTFRCFEDNAACTPTRLLIEENTFKVWSSFPEEVTFKAIHSSALESNEYGVPILKDMYLAMMEECPDALTYTFINGDIIGTHDYIDSINAALTMKKDFFMTGKRFNVQWNDSMDVEDEDLDWTNTPGSLFARCAQDYFTVTKNAIDWNTIPPLVIGRGGYDNWLTDHAYDLENVMTVDSTHSAKMVHQSEVHTHEGHSEGVHGFSDADAHYNAQLLAEAGLVIGEHGYTTEMEYRTWPTSPISIHHRSAGQPKSVA